jgi:CRP-like cAMP-binding protein
VVGVLGPGDFFGESCLAGQPVRMSTASAMVPSRVLTIGRNRMRRLLRQEPDLANRFIAYVLARNVRVEEDLVDRMARYGEPQGGDWILPKVSQETLAEMVGTTRPRINFFMNKFRSLGFIDYNGVLVVRTALLGVVLHD